MQETVIVLDATSEDFGKVIRDSLHREPPVVTEAYLTPENINIYRHGLSQLIAQMDEQLHNRALAMCDAPEHELDAFSDWLRRAKSFKRVVHGRLGKCWATQRARLDECENQRGPVESSDVQPRTVESSVVQ